MKGNRDDLRGNGYCNTPNLPLEWFHVSCLLSPSVFFLQVVKDRVCLRALEKMIDQLVDSKEQAELLSASALQPLDVNADGTYANFCVIDLLFL